MIGTTVVPASKGHSEGPALKYFNMIHRGGRLVVAAALTRVMRGAVPIPAVAAASVLHSAAVGGSVAGDVGAL